MRFQHQSSRQWMPIALGAGVIAALTIVIVLLAKLAPRMFTPAPPPVIVTTGTIQSGDVFGLLLTKKGGLDPKYVGAIQKSFKEQLSPESIQPGVTFEITTSTDGVFKQFVYKIDDVHSYTVKRSSEGVYSSNENVQKTVWMEKRISVEITKFLEADLRAAGYNASLIDNLTFELGETIFGWRIDFFTEQRKGDKLDVLLEEEYLPGSDKPIKGGRHMRVIVASYTGSGTKHKENIAVRYQGPKMKRPEYFDADGKAMRRQFLRSPFTKSAFRISSGFSLKRFHPIRRTFTSHQAIDYAASPGTPVAAIGGGTVIRAGWFGGYGNCIDIRHNNRYISRYGHLSKIAVRNGQSVAQGQYIGKVGSTGLSTGPHLHFEMIVDGNKRNFLRMNFPASSEVEKSDMPEFERIKDEVVARLNAIPVSQPPKQVAMNPVKE